MNYYNSLHSLHSPAAVSISTILHHNIISIMAAITLQFSTIPVGQWVLSKADSMLQIISEAVVWSSKDSPRSLPWILFLPLLAFVHWTRMVLSVTLYILLGVSVTPAVLNKFIKPLREFLQDSIQRGGEIREEKREAMSRTDLNEFFLYRMTKTFVFRPIDGFSRKSLYFFGLIPSIVSKKDETVNDMVGNGSEEQGEPQHYEHQHHQEHQEHHDHHHY